MDTYPLHVIDKKRVAMVSELLQKECIKLLPSLSKLEWQKASRDITNWFEGEKSDLAPVHDFWNLADGIMVGSKLKQVIKYFSAENISWQREEVGTRKIDIEWQVGEFDNLELPYTFESITRLTAEDPKVLEKNIRLSDGFEKKYKPREYFPVILVENKNNRFSVLDGNRRVLRSVLYKKDRIAACKGSYISGSEPLNYWVTTGELRKLLYIAERASEENNKTVVEAVKTILNNYFKQSEIAKINWNLRCRDKSDFSRQLMP